MDSSTLLTVILSSSVIGVLIASGKELILWRLNRKAKLADEEKQKREERIEEAMRQQQRSIEKLSDKIDKVKTQMDATVQHDKVILHDKIRYLISKYIEYGEISLDERQFIHHMWDIYHYDLGGNGDLDEWMAILDEIPLKEGAHP